MRILDIKKGAASSRPVKARFQASYILAQVMVRSALDSVSLTSAQPALAFASLPATLSAMTFRVFYKKIFWPWPCSQRM